MTLLASLCLSNNAFTFPIINPSTGLNARSFSRSCQFQMTSDSNQGTKLKESFKFQSMGLLASGVVLATVLSPEASFAAYEGAEPEPKAPLPTTAEIIKELKQRQSDPELVIQTFAKVNEMANDDEALIDPREKKEVVRTLIQKKKDDSAAWNEEVALGYSIIKRKLDPYNVVALAGYLKAAPFVGGALYLALIWVQKNVPSVFDYAYVAGAAAFFLPFVAIAFSS